MGYCAWAGMNEANRIYQRSPGARHREHSVNKRTVFTFERDEEV